MSRFNQKQETKKVENLAGGQSYQLSDKNALITFLFSTFMTGKFYDTNEVDTLKKLVHKIKDKQFVAKAGIYTRNVLGMRSVSHALAGELVKSYNNLSGQEWVKYAIEKFVKRPDDITEILAYYLQEEKKIPHSLKNGLAKSFDKFNAYQLAKYKEEGKEVSLVDAIRLLNVKPNDTNREALNKLIYGQLKSFDTWESELSKVGSDQQLKSEVWRNLLFEDKIGYMALLKNLSNLIKSVPDCIGLICKKLTDRKAIKSSLVLPFRFYTAYNTIFNNVEDSKEERRVRASLSKALDISLDNVKPLKGNTLVVLDTSGSMMSVSDKAGIFAAVLAKVNNADLMFFSDHARYVSYNPESTTMDIVDSFTYEAGGTNFSSIFRKANKNYDNIIILSDMQGWVGYFTPELDLKEYKRRYGANPKIYSFDLAGYGTSEFKEGGIYLLSGFSEKVFDLMEMLDKDRNAIIKEIDSIQLCDEQ